MQIHPSRDVIRQTFRDAFSGECEEVLGNSPETDSSGDLIFTKEDILKTSDVLSQMLRGIFVEKGVTYQYLARRYREYALNTLRILPTKVSTGKGNLMSAIHRPILSFKKFYEVVVLILGYDVDMTITLTDHMGEKMSFNHHEMVNDTVNRISGMGEQS